MKMRAQNQAEIKLNNRNLVMELLIRKAPISRIELSKVTGLSKMTVTNIIKDLVEEGLVIETGAEQTAFGRKPITLQIKPKSKIFLGVYIARNKVCVVAGDLCGNLLAEKSVVTPQNQQLLMEEIYRLLDAVISEFESDKIQSIGVASIAPLDFKNGIILNPPNFFGIENLEIVKLLEERYPFSVYLDREVNAAALAEWLFGKAKQISDYIYVGVANGIGAAIMSEDKLYRGAGGFGGEIGHITVDLNGERCSCGNIGCLEMYASVTDTAHIDLERINRYLPSGLVTLINLFDPQTIFLGHDIAVAGEPVAKMLEESIRERFISRGMKEIKVEISAFKEIAPEYGAFALAVCRYIAKI